MPQHILANIMFDQKNIPQKLAHKFNLQLSALAFCLGDSDDYAVLDFIPSQDYLKRLQALNLPTLKSILKKELPLSTRIDPWILSKQLPYELKYPYHPLIETLACKAQASKIYQPIFDFKLVHCTDDVLHFLQGKQGLYVLKLPDGQSGMGHIFFDAQDSDLIKKISGLDIKNSRLEKWMPRLVDFSSQWLLDQSVELLGICEIINNNYGCYQGSIYPFSRPEYQPFIQEHIVFMKPYLEKFFKQGLRGHIGVDAFIYKDQEIAKLCPMIEINPRKTMGLVALKLSEHFQKPCKLEIANQVGERSLLPSVIQHQGQTVSYQKNINLTFL